jgi:peptidoglycan hydrolase CwlO-like protein
MLEYNSELTLSFFAAALLDQLAALNVEPGDQDSAAKSLANLKNELAKKRLAQEKAQADVESLSRVVEDIKKTADQLVAHIPSLETQVKNLNDKIADLNTVLQTRELILEQTTTTKDDFQCQNTRLTKKLEGKHSSPCTP